MRVRLFLSFILIVFISVASVVIAARQSAAQEVRAFMVRGGMTGMDELAGELEDYYRATGNWQGVERLLSSPGHGQGMGPGGSGGMMGGAMINQRLRLADPQGNVVFDSLGQPGGSLSEEERNESLRLSSGLETVGSLLVEGGMSAGGGNERFLLNRLNRAAFTAGLVAGSVSLLIALLIAYTLLRPVRELTHAAELLAKGDLSQRVPVRGDDELAALGRTFNHMADSLQRAKESRRSMTADLAHELRNPLAVQRANLEALQDGIYPLTPENLEPILEQNLLLSRLVDDLRTLAMADAGQLTLERTPTDFPALVRRVAERFEPQTASRKIRLRFDLPEKPSFSLSQLIVDPLRMEQIINNLLSNALRYTPEGGQISLQLNDSDGSVQLTVHDSGPGVPPEALPHIFERFYRAERSRSRSEGGTGLGLAIARQLAQAHGGSLEAENHPKGGAIFTLKLPYAGENNKR